MQNRRATSRDVAAAAGVSQPTVSRALRGDSGVGEETRRRIAEIAAQLNYTPDRRGSSLRSGSTSALAVVMLMMPGEGRSGLNPFYLELLGAIGLSASRRGYDLLVSFQDMSDSLRGNFAAAGKADGTVVIGSARNRTGWGFFADAEREGEPIVCWGAPDDALATVRCDNVAAAAAAVRHLIARDRRRIALVAPGWQQQLSFAERRQGYLDALRDAGLAPIEAPDDASPAREDQGHAATLALLDTGAKPDAIFAASDILAFGAMRALHERGLAIPTDVAVVGFDGIASAAHSNPPLTTIEQDCDSAGEALVETLLDTITGRSAPVRTAGMRLVCRASS